MPIAQHMSAALAPGSKEGGVSLGGWVWAQGLFFTTGGGRDHIKFFITDLQKMRELHVLLSLVWVSFFLVFSLNSSRKVKCRRQVSQAPGFRSEGSREAGRSCYFRLALGSVPASREQSLKPQFFSSPVPRWPPWRAAGQEHLGLLCLEAWSPKHRPTGARQRKEAEGASTEGW